MTSETTSENAKHRSTTSRMMVWAGGICIALMLYVASIGPTSVLIWRTESPMVQKTLGCFYWPLSQVVPRNSPVERVFGMYVKWWMDVTHTEGFRIDLK